MPEEAVCTENLTPWTKLLPGRDQSGFGLLLNPLTIYNSLFHSMGALARIRLPADCSTVRPFFIFNFYTVTMAMILTRLRNGRWKNASKE